MTVQNVRIIQLKKEYVGTIEGQDNLTKIVDKQVECDNMIEFSEGDYGVTDIALVACEVQGDSDNKTLIEDMQVIDRLLNIFKISAEEGTGVLYIQEIW